MLHGEESTGNDELWHDGVDNLLFDVAANLASSPGGRAIIVRSLSSPSLSLRKAKVHSSVSDIVFNGRPRPSRGGALYVVDGR